MKCKKLLNCFNELNFEEVKDYKLRIKFRNTTPLDVVSSIKFNKGNIILSSDMPLHVSSFRYLTIKNINNFLKPYSNCELYMKKLYNRSYHKSYEMYFKILGIYRDRVSLKLDSKINHYKNLNINI